MSDTRTHRSRSPFAVLAATCVLVLTGCADTPTTPPAEETAVTIEETGEMVHAIGDEVTALVPADLIAETARHGDRPGPVAGSDNDPDGILQSWDLSIDFYMQPGTVISTVADDMRASLEADGWTPISAVPAPDVGRAIFLRHPDAGDYQVRILTGADGGTPALIGVNIAGPVVDTERNVLAE